MNLPRPRSGFRAWTIRVRSSWALPAFVVLLGVSVVLLAVAALVTDYARDLLLNLGAGFVILAFGSVVFEPVIEQARRGRVTDGPRLDHRHFCERIAQAEQSVVIHGTWTGLLEQEHRDFFFEKVTRALDRDVSVRLLLINPDSAQARLRAQELRKTVPDVDGLIRENLRLLDDFVQERDGKDRIGKDRTLPEVRIYAASASETLYQVDERAIVGKLPLDRLGYNSPQSEADVHHPLMTGLVNRVEEIWSYPSPRTIPLADYMTVEAVISVYAVDSEEPVPSRVRLRYVIDPVDHSWYVMAHEASDPIPLHLGGTMRARVIRPMEDQTESPLVPTSSRGMGIREWFKAKYGPAVEVGDVHYLSRPASDDGLPQP